MIISLPTGPWIISGDEPVRQTCYLTKNASPKLSADSLDKPDRNMASIDHFETFGIDATHPERQIRIGASLSNQLQRNI